MGLESYCQTCGAPLYRGGCTNVLCTGALGQGDAPEDGGPVQLRFLLGELVSEAPIPFSDPPPSGDGQYLDESAD